MASKFSFEKSVRRISEISEKMQEGDLALEESVELFEEGNKLIRQCQDYLRKTELRVKKIIDKDAPEQMEEFEVGE